ncbi:uncharacterized protein L203_102812 [Cryptococcus depauperatus CBS 7841]|uniref:Uncharacterized protein n=1 Tax=Cryptococcus depauperatus CBS 7841 TaxID=1295531 RepID=A0AAJ8JSI0_9TREE
MTEHTREQLPLWQDEPGADRAQRRWHTLAASGTGDEPGVDVQSQRDEQTYGHLRGESRIEVVDYAPSVGGMNWTVALDGDRLQDWLESPHGRRPLGDDGKPLGVRSCRRRQLGRREGVDGAIRVRECLASTADWRRLHPLAVEDALEAAEAPRSKLDFYKDHLYLQLLIHRPGGRDERSELVTPPARTHPAGLGKAGAQVDSRPAQRGIHGARPEEHPERVYAARRDTPLDGRRATGRRAGADIRPSARQTLAPAAQWRRRVAGTGDARHRGRPRGRDGNRPPPPHPLLPAHPSPPRAETAAACVLRRAGPGRTALAPRDDRQSVLSLLALSSHATPLVAAQAATLGFFSPLTKVYVEDVIDHLEMVTGSLEQFAATCDRLTDYVFVRLCVGVAWLMETERLELSDECVHGEAEYRHSCLFAAHVHRTWRAVVDLLTP